MKAFRAVAFTFLVVVAVLTLHASQAATTLAPLTVFGRVTTPVSENFYDRTTRYSQGEDPQLIKALKTAAALAQ